MIGGEQTAVFVDLANFYSSLIRSGIGEPRELRDYFLNWLDFDLIVGSLTEGSAPIWVFYSGRRLGRKSERVERDVLAKYIERINRLPGVTAYDVEIPGEQREPITVTCDKCGDSTSVVWESEKGVDAALIVHLFDTSEAWDRAFVTLRRRGFHSGGAVASPARETNIRRGLQRFQITDTGTRGIY